jgi:hypothetical protein
VYFGEFVDNLVTISEVGYVKCKNKGVYLREEKINRILKDGTNEKK